jgi:L-lysine 6-transaminase
MMEIMQTMTSQTKESIAGRIEPDRVHEVLSRHIQADGFPLVVDTAASRGADLVDAVTGTHYLDLYTFFASSPLGMNPPGITGDQEFMALLAEVAANKPANSDAYTTHYAEFVETFARVLGDPALPHLFFIEGGALAVENALKTAFDWKSRRNEAAGRSSELGSMVLHLTRAFHGRTGYTLSLTNTDPVKTARFPKFGWPRIDVPAMVFPIEDHLDAVIAAEQHALAQARAAFEQNPHDIACFIAEPIQGEGGDRHFRPQFFAAMRALCDEYDALLIFDEVQTGCGITGTAWAYQQLGVTPDVVAFGKKTQVCGVMAGRRVDEVPDNVFHVSSRINSTWGGNLVDMVRARRILETIEADRLFDQAADTGRYLLGRLGELAEDFPGTVLDARGRGLMCAFTLPTPQQRDDLIAKLWERGVVMLASGHSSVRFRPALTVTRTELDLAVAAVRAALS